MVEHILRVLSADIVKKSLVFVFLLGQIFVSGCAATGNSGESEIALTAPSRENTLPFPGSRRKTKPAGESDKEGRITANVVAYRAYRDPLIGLNRGIFALNDFTYRYLLIPVSRGYTRITPDRLERGIDNFFYNIKTPIYAVSHLLQLKIRPMGTNLARFGINSTAGLLGFLDPAGAWLDMKRTEAHLEDSFSHYGLGYGIYLVLPILGPADVRNSISTAGEYFLNPVIYLTANPATTAIQGFDYLQEFAPQVDRYETLRRESEDPYIFFRNMYLQGVQRDAAY